MAIDRKIEHIMDVQDRLDSAVRAVEALKHGGGDGTSGGMEARIARLESDMEHVKKSLDKVDGGVSEIRKSLGDFRVEFAKIAGEMTAKVSGIDERTKLYPSTKELLATAAIMVAVIGGIVALVVRYLPQVG